ncbi:type I-D CRISPR-associated protein Cas7/Csc2 [Inediibacterium massiliense]|uniref:type I-D CRISPR-associated protein Cas7/Csc2 n=1 Tax=Inediibacterium massiliense TaxID=1658111 RepID=UPI0006B44A90|nr:type I-D CRISPR-associated protein Cas7/Csc2 [Inediibacterium massiliense]
MSKNIIEELKDKFQEKYSNFPEGKYITVGVLREIQSETIFRTEGSGEGLNKERTRAGIENSEVVSRVVISKRKQIAVERRIGREYLRANDLLFTTSKKEICALNKNTPCGKCLDCMLYGYAVGDGGAQKARVISDNSFSILPFNDVVGVKTFNALFDNGTMRDENGKASSSINEDEYIKPGTLFLDMVTFKDVTVIEFIYGIANILRSKRYGAISSRMGKVKNHILKIAFSDCEMFSNLELVQSVYDQFKKAELVEHPLDFKKCIDYTKDSFDSLKNEVCGEISELSNEQLDGLINYVKKLFANEKENEKAAELFKEQSSQYGV